jgi:hypothetical protein
MSRNARTVFFNGTGQYMLNILPARAILESAYFAEEIIDGLEVSCYPEGSIAHERRITLHFDNVPSAIQNVSKRK